MVDKKELRIGNYVSYIETAIVPVKVLDNSEVEIIIPAQAITFKQGEPRSRPEGAVWKVGYEEVFPISLDAQMLVKCGFTPEYRRDDTTIYRKGSIGIDLEMDGWVEYNNTPIEEVNIKYLHQLQNLYFKLTGEELYIDL